jgi:lipoyl(octanoyl) transferase
MDLSPFLSINPCGYQGMEMVNLTELGIPMTMEQTKQQFVSALKAQISLDI